jgi:hypothetical protein
MVISTKKLIAASFLGLGGLDLLEAVGAAL